MARAFPTLDSQQRLNRITEVFEHPDNLERLCHMSGGHVQTLLGMLSRALETEDPPLSKKALEAVFREYRDSIILGITDDEWKLLKQIDKEKQIGTEEGFDSLLRNRFVFEYLDEEGNWFDINPVLKDTDQFKSS